LVDAIPRREGRNRALDDACEVDGHAVSGFGFAKCGAFDVLGGVSVGVRERLSEAGLESVVRRTSYRPRGRSYCEWNLGMRPWGYEMKRSR
jgi:hypothetical protein